MSERKPTKMTTIKVSVQTAAIVANTVRRLKAQGVKRLTADKLLMKLMAEKYPEDTRIILESTDDPYDLLREFQEYDELDAEE